MKPPIIGFTSHMFRGPVNCSAVNQMYIDAVACAGGAPVCVPLMLGLPALEQIYDLLDGLFLPGGDDVAPERYGQQPHPCLGAVDENRDDLEITLAEWALRDDLPILGICRGSQVLAVAAGGTLVQDVPSEVTSELSHDVRGFGRDYLCHTVDVQPDTLLAEILGGGSVLVNSFHHQAVCDVPPGFVVSASAPDGVIEAIEAPGRRYVLGIQCHPEGLWRTTAPHFEAVFTSFVEAAASHSLARAAMSVAVGQSDPEPLAAS